MKFLLPILFFFGLFAVSVKASEMTAGFDHETHLNKVFLPNKIDCAHCHNFSLDQSAKEIKLTNEAKESILKISLKQVCHECHSSDMPKYNKAPQTCFTCHRTMEGIKKIKPPNHESISWRTGHSLEARVRGESCMNCHMTSQCSKCHLQRNDVDLRNHPPNFRYFHSVVARGQPQRCDACHAKSFCANCHLGKK